jgi:uncharacterized membrane-anchored protein
VTEEQNAKTPAFAPHALRGRVLAEVHARPLVPMEGAKRILHFAFTTDPAAAAKAREALEAFCLDRAYPAPAPEAKQHRVELPPAILRWEHHGEFMTYSWEFPQDAPKVGLGDPGQLAFRPGAGELSSFMRLLPQPGPLLVAADLHLLPEGPCNDEWRSLFEPSQLAASEAMEGAAIIATDFQPDAFGFVRLLVLDRRLTPGEAGHWCAVSSKSKPTARSRCWDCRKRKQPARSFAASRRNCRFSCSGCGKAKGWTRAASCSRI